MISILIMLLQYYLAGNLVLINRQHMMNYVEIVLYVHSIIMLNVCQPVFSIKSSNLNVLLNVLLPTCYRTLELTCVYMQTRAHTCTRMHTHTHTHTQLSSFTQNRLQLILHNVPLVLCY